MAALYHDAPEIITGDMLHTGQVIAALVLRDAYKALETERALHDWPLPDELSEELSPFTFRELLTAEEKRPLKAADRLSALINKCTEEQRSGNQSLTRRWPSRKRPWYMHCPEADYRALSALLHPESGMS